MGTTPSGLPYPEPTHTPDVPRDIKALALAIDARVCRVTHPNGTDVHVQAWDAALARWQTVHYDSGWRDVSSLRMPAWTAGTLYMRRANDTVTVMVAGVKGPASFSYLMELPTGFTHAAYSNSPTSWSWREPVVNGAFYTATAFGMQVGYESNASSIGWSVDHVVKGTVSFATTDAIPTTLPGTAVGTAPAADEPQMLPAPEVADTPTVIPDAPV